MHAKKKKIRETVRCIRVCRSLAARRGHFSRKNETAFSIVPHIMSDYVQEITRVNKSIVVSIIALGFPQLSLREV
jgi:ABC-type antimicrobial peptide transport system permease subunit